MSFSIKYGQKKSAIDEDIIIGQSGFNIWHQVATKLALLHIKIYHTVLKEFDDLLKSLCELAINEVFNGKRTEYEHPIQSERFNIYTVKSNIEENIDPVEFVSAMTIELSEKIYELINDKLSKEPKTDALRV